MSVTIAFRLPSCGESFWLDELHSAWAVSGTFHEVSPRAAIGNQTTGYFHLLWSWQTMVGNREIEMRLSSVVASCLAAALLVVGVTQRTGSVCAGMVAGAVLAVDPNGVFFGCELRPYAFVILYSVLATWSMMTWIGGSKPSGDKASRLTRNSYGGARWRLAMLFWICVAALVHPTSLGVLALLIPVAFAVAWKTGKLILWRADAFAAIIAVTTLGALAMSSLPESWERRDLWKAFGQATSWWQLWYAWSWVPILGIPIATAAVLWLAVWLIERLVSKRPPHSSTCDSPGGSGWIGMIPGLIGLAGTFVFFCASYFEWVPLWHRRYFVAALPMLAWTTGEMAGCCADALIRIFGGTGKPGFGVTWRIIVSRIGGAVVGVLFIAVMLWYQGTMHTLASGKMPLQLRGERWREAVAVISDQMQNGDVVWLDSQLIEASFLRHPVSQSESIGDAQWEYLRFPLAGPYRLEPVVVVACAEHDSWIRQHLAGLPAGRARVWLIARCGKPAAERFVQRISRYRNVTAAERYGGLPFVLRLDFTQ
ncbi:MAG: hypothetical protein KDB00_10230 [Planctomycetales bacterium]|nr:hypothetical protein [Planctomycetales bacterium]